MKSKKIDSSGYSFVIIGVCLYAISDSIIKYFLSIYDVNQVTFFRTIFRFIPIVIWVIIKGENPLISDNVPLNIVRAIIASFGTYCFLLAYKYAPMTDVVVIGYSNALFVIPLGVLFLGEKVKKYEIIAVLIGFIGILISFRPFDLQFHYGVLFAVIGAFISALNQVIIRKLSKTDKEITIIFYHHLVLILGSFFIGFSGFRMPGCLDFIFLLIAGLIGALAQFCMIHALKLSKTSTLASGSYVMLLPVTLIDYFFYEKTPDIFIIIGLIFILFSSSLILRKNQYHLSCKND